MQPKNKGVEHDDSHQYSHIKTQKSNRLRE